MLKGISGWSLLKLNIVDVTKIEGFNLEKRMFKMFDREYPFTLTVWYYEKTAFKYDSYRIKKRYKTLDEAQNEINEIFKKQQQLCDPHFDQNL